MFCYFIDVQGIQPYPQAQATLAAGLTDRYLRPIPRQHTIDIHKAIGKLPIIPKRGFTLPNMNYCGPYIPLNKQLIYDKNGNILRCIQNPSGKTYEISAQHDVDYTLSKNLYDEHNADEKMINSINNLPYKGQQYGTFLVRNIIISKRKLGLGNPNEILSNELHKPRKINFTRRKVISNHIDHV